ncbi:uncharacterized protein M421DRAFT_422068 [Didymella exigua CBS 183.55]|uniref:BZIP domain-containing protein n=1 Tax=Didymella exigua CBS 183.55 TaxID=1150837 RepID=A0A6A5RHH0_9PLEO|nr:uncharacterized protein M421DRAFT_422068 [Didymella exigua CBS 183.55]KAF1927212.1 hypothetical protein M421DRAFT_422068 [Didymella exigua CBS 183.55]
MATAVQPAMIIAPAFNPHINHCQDPDQEFFDFSQLPSPTQQPRLKRESIAVSNIASPTSTTIEEELQEAAKPSHEYERFKQQTGIPAGSIACLNAGFNSGYPVFSSSGLDMMGNDSMMEGWNSGIGMDINMAMDYAPNNYMSYKNDQDDFVDPSAIQQEEVPAVRLYPGMHQQQAALAKAQQQAQQAAQQQRQQQQIAHQRQQAQLHAQQQQRPASRKISSPLSDERTEATIQRVVAQIRADSQNAALASQDPNGNVLPHIIRAKKDEDDMDEDERLLASEEGKKLSSKERRQLRNKVSARAFRSRRKEYIGQLEGEVAVKVQEANELRNQNNALMEESRRQQAFIERLLRHQAFNPFLEELVKEQQDMSAPAPLASMPSSSTPAAPAPVPAPAQFQFSQPENTHVGMTMIPETQLDFSMLNINNNANWNMGNGFNGYQPQGPRVFAVTELPEGPANPLDISAMSGKGLSTIFAVENEASAEELKADYPIIERPVQSEQTFMAPIEEADAEDEEYDLYRSSPAPTAAPTAPVELTFTMEKASRYTLVVSDEASEAILAERLEKKIAAMESAFQRIAAITTMLDY